MASKYMMRKFKSDFSEVCEMWTGEDGMLISLTIARSPNAAEALKGHWAFRKGEAFQPERMVERFAYRDTFEEHDRIDGQRKCWRVGDTPNDFPIYEYELQIPR